MPINFLHDVDINGEIKGDTLNIDGAADITGNITGLNGSLTTTSSYYQLNTPSGYIQMGAMNTSHAHMYTDRPDFYFNKAIQINGANVLTTANTDAYFQNGDVVMNENPFGGRSLYNSMINNPWFLAADRYTVTQTGGSSIANAFDGNYESSYLIAANGTATFNIDFGQHPGYPYGWIYLSFYYTNQPSSISGRVYNNYAPHTVGWSALTFTDVVNNSQQRIVKARQSKFGLTDLEITLTAPAGTTVKLTSCEIHLDRPGTQEMPVFNKFRAETIYKPLTVNSTITSTGKITGTELDINGNADISGSTTLAGLSASSVTTPLIQLQGDLNVLNKAQTSYLTLADRDTSGSEVVYNLANVGSATFTGTLASGAFTSTDRITGTTLEGTSLDINGNADISGNLTITGGILNNVENASLDIYGGNDTTNDAHIKLHGNANNWGSMELNYGYDATNSYFKVKQGSTENFVLQGGNATFGGNVTTGASLVSTNAIVDNVTAKTSSGNITFKTNAGSTIAQFYNNLSATFAGSINAGTITGSGNAVFGSDTNAQLIAGRGKIGAYVNDYVYFSHIDYGTSSNYALNQSHLGNTGVNAKTGGTVSLNINNSPKLTVVGDKIGIGTSSPSDKLTIEDATAPNFKMYRSGTGQVWQQTIDSSGRYMLREAASNGGTLYTRFQVDDTGEAEFMGDLTIPNKVIHTGDTDTWFGFDDGNDTWRVVTGAAQRLDINNTRVRITNSNLEVNGGTSIIHADGLFVKNPTNGGIAQIKFSDAATGSYDQVGHIKYQHGNTVSYGSGESFIIGGTESTTTILADGKLMYSEGIYSKPASGTGAGTRVDTNWNTAYTHSQATHAPSNAEQNVQSDWNATSGDALILNKPSIPSVSGLATTSYVDTAVANVIDSAPGTLNTLNELAQAINDDVNFSTTITNSIATKLPLSGGTMSGAIAMGNNNITGVNNIQANGNVSLQTSTGEYALYANANGQTALYNNGLKKFETTSTGATVNSSTATFLIEGSGVTSSNLKFRSNTVDRWNVNVPSGQTNLAFTTGSTNVLSLDTSNNATFAGNVIATDGSDTATLKFSGLILSRSNSYIQSNADNSDTLNIGQPSVRWGNIKVDGATFKVFNGGTERFGINSSGAATFANNLTVSGGTLNLGNDVSIFDDGVNILRTDDVFHANNDIHVGGAGKLFDRADPGNYIELANTINISTNTDISGNLTVNNTITTPTDTNLSLSPNGSGHVYFGNAGNGMNLYHYSSANDGKYTTHDFNGNYYRLSTTAISGVWINDPLRIEGAVDINSNVDISGHLSVDTITAATIDTDRFLVADSGNRIYSRTGAQVLSDIGGQAAGTYLTGTETTVAPASITLSVVDDTINVTFAASTTSNIDNYLVFSSVDGGDYGLISIVPPEDMASSMSIIDNSFDVTGTQAYRIYAVKNGNYSSPRTGSISYSAGTVEPLNMSVVNLNKAYYIQWNAPSTKSRFVTAYNVYKHQHATQGSLDESSASLIYSGMNTNFMYAISGNSNDFHKFWVTTTIA